MTEQNIELLNKKTLIKYIIFGIVCLILFPISPLIIGSVCVYKIIKSSASKKDKYILAILSIIFAFLFTAKIGELLPSTTPATKPEVKSENIEVFEEPTSDINTSPTPDENEIFVKVTNVIDGDTFTIESGEVVRMIGIDTPETVHPSKPVECYGKEASNKTEELIEGKIVKLEKDISETDKYNRLLRYVYIDSVFVNEYLVAEGYAKQSSYPPDINYQERFKEAQKKAQDENKGLWNTSVCLLSTPTSKPIITTKPSTPKPAINVITPTQKSSVTVVQTEGNSYICNCSKTCPNMSCSEAQYQLNVCGCSARDADKDGVACDAQCQ